LMEFETRPKDEADFRPPQIVQKDKIGNFLKGNSFCSFKCRISLDPVDVEARVRPARTAAKKKGGAGINRKIRAVWHASV
jgi:hypothetical protein